MGSSQGSQRSVFAISPPSLLAGLLHLPLLLNAKIDFVDLGDEIIGKPLVVQHIVFVNKPTVD